MRQDDRPKETEKLDEQPQGDRRYSKPKLTYVAPELTELGDIKEFTAGFFGSFSAS